MGRSKRTLLTSAVLIFALAPASLAQSLKPACKVLSQPGAPVRITEYQCAYLDGVVSVSESRISHRLFFQNASAGKIAAVEFGLIAFDVWDEFLTQTGGFAMDGLAPQQQADESWSAHGSSNFSFHTGVAYIRKVRLESGEIWTADLAAVLDELKKIQPDFAEADLRKIEPAAGEK